MSDYNPKCFALPNGVLFNPDRADATQATLDPYLFPREALIALDVALATKRPLLVAGPPGCGKSRLAEAMAALLGWSFVHQTITSRTRLEQLTVEVDQLRRLNDAQLAARSDQHALARRDEEYYNPGAFWWAFDAASARRRGLPDSLPAPRSEPRFPGVERLAKDDQPAGTVLLLDEIDKAEPDLPNDLLEPLDRGSFGLPDGRTLYADPQRRWLTIITTNGERDLPAAFARRCATLLLDAPAYERLREIADVHAPKVDQALVEKIARRVIDLREELQDSGRRPPSTSEFLDAVRACQELGIDVDSELWSQIERVTLRKPLHSER